MTQQNYKIVPAVEKTNPEKIHDLRMFLAANLSVNIADGELEKAAQFQQHLDVLALLVEQSRDRI